MTTFDLLSPADDGGLEVRLRAQLRTPRPSAPRHLHPTQDRRSCLPSVVLDFISRRCLTLYFYRFSEDHEFIKPNDVRALRLMDEAAGSVMEIFPDITLAFGQSDEFRQVDSDVRNGTIVAEELSCDQFLV